MQPLQIALASGTEAKIASDPHLRHAQRAHQKFLDEAIGGPARELVREGDDQQRVDVHLAQQLFFLGDGEDLLRHPIRRDDGQRMRLERDHRGGPPQLARPRHHPAHDGLMPDVHAVEVADGGDAAARQVRLA